jgi:hypothetical protein
MIRRLLFVGVLTYVVISISRARTKRSAGEQKDRDAKANWDFEGGSPAPDPVDTPVAG